MSHVHMQDATQAVAIPVLPPAQQVLHRARRVSAHLSDIIRYKTSPQGSVVDGRERNIGMLQPTHYRICFLCWSELAQDMSSTQE